MTNQDFDQSDAEVLAEFVGFEYDYDGNLKRGRILDRHGNWHNWRPWSLHSEQWQIQSLLDAVREKGLGDEFIEEMCFVVEDTNFHREAKFASFNLMTAPAEAICSAILSLEVD